MLSRSAAVTATLAAGLAALTLLLLLPGLGDECGWDHRGHNTAYYGMAARNLLRYGYVELGFFHCIEPGARVVHPTMYFSHPPMCSIAASLCIAIFGESEAALRLPALVLSVLTVPLFFLWMQVLLDGRRLLAAAATLGVTCSPLFVYYGTHLEPLGPGTLFSITGSLYFAEKWLRGGAWRHGLGCAAFWAFGFTWDWPCFLVPGYVGLTWLLHARRRGALRAFACWAFAALGGALVFLWILAAGRATDYQIESLFAQAEHRNGLAGMETDQGESIGFSDWFDTVLGYHVDQFWWPLTLLALVAGVEILRRIARGTLPGRSALALVPLVLGLSYVVLFPQGAYVHDYWQHPMTLGVTPPLFVLLHEWTKGRKTRALVPCLLAIALVLVAFGAAQSFDRKQEQASETHARSSRRLGLALRQFVAADEVFLYPHDGRSRIQLRYYADRKSLPVPSPDLLPAAAQQLPAVGVKLRGILLPPETSPAWRTQAERLGWHGPIPLGSHEFWRRDP